MNLFRHPIFHHVLLLVLCPFLFSCGGQSSRQDATDSLEQANALPERSQDTIVAHACRIMDAAARDLSAAGDIPAVCHKAGDAIGRVAKYSDSLTTEQRHHLDTPEARQALREAKGYLQECYDRRILEIRRGQSSQK